MEIYNLTTMQRVPDMHQAECDNKLCLFVHSRDTDGNPQQTETKPYIYEPQTEVAE